MSYINGVLANFCVNNQTFANGNPLIVFNTTSDQAAQKVFTSAWCAEAMSFFPNLVKIGPQMTSTILSTDVGQPEKHQTDGHRTHQSDFEFCPVLCMALDRKLSLKVSSEILN